MKRKIFLYAEGSFKRGLGNIYRTIALGKEILKNCSAEVYFITSSDMYILDIIRKEYMPIITFKDYNEFFNIIKINNPDILIIDQTNILVEIVKHIRPYVKKLVHIGNVSKANKFADVVINAIIGTNYKNKVRVDEFNTKYLEGPKYLSLRDEFYYKKGSYKYTGELNKILLSFGGTDQANLTTKVLSKLNRISSKKNICIIKGAGFKFDNELFKEVQKNKKHTIKIFKNISNMSDVMLKSDLIFTSPGTTLYEACILKVPVIAFYQTEEQNNMHKDYKFAFDFCEVKNLEKIIFDFYESYDSYLRYINKFHFGEGKKEIVKECSTYNENH
ncbi:PseG/SpsG family protein [Clostridium cochlearium]|uniref:Spore coat polysaccharide biosynthesis protein spsG n=1 Tax=Clostridium cochlearium TaxID=1494 RepID=A0A2X2W4H7_CLOCO|nr:glycosyltransferase [Clostridium cochlearium]NOH16440.1 hypothetical protein [Clostridium cochlearium]SQB35748.1 spore coat polysaccharide biosynthesis protein spsG [Clostridium cochlearium]